ncbi:AsnC family transcriptional regulator [Nesterenkonia marinintestina]|uniref:AsnC family transcriptional regulator n=1 Tax=Nesterenkonia marinintestina TaxID=2979865 RepID=UPI0021BF11CE|nr:AsnC family transcriptional regulator [Nesterenkonia sp. GX14115]
MMDPLELRIAEALQCDPRASWRRVAAALGENERMIARRGGTLLARRSVVVAGVRTTGTSMLLRGTCHPGARATAAESLATRPEVTFSYMLAGAYDVVAEVFSPATERPYSLDASITPGFAHAETLPILHYFRTIRGWRLGVLSDSERGALSLGDEDTMPVTHHPEGGSEIDEAIIGSLVDDGRTSIDELARRAGTSQSTARRHLDALIAEDRLHLRALVEPERAGLRTEALLWLRVAPHRVPQVGTAIAADPKARYVAAIAGSSQLVADITVSGPQALYTYLAESEWAQDIDSVEVSVVAGARKRGGQLFEAPGATVGHSVASS